MSDTVFSKIYTAPPVNKKEILRYAGCRRGGEEFLSLAEECLAEAEPTLDYRVCWFYMKWEDQLPPPLHTSKTLKRHLADCNEAVIFAATVGIGLDRLITKYCLLSPAKALMMQAVGAERVEALCDAFCEDIAGETGRELCARFSPGYGDWPLATQADLFRLLDPMRKIGLSLNESLIMSPTKSVTAVVGIKR